MRRSVTWSGQQTLALLAQSAERAPDALRALAQAFAARTPVVLLTSDGALYRDLEPYAGAFEALVGAQELSHLRFCLEELRAPNLWGTGASARPLIIVDGLDSWLEALVRQPDTENLLYDFSRRVPSRLFGGVHLRFEPAWSFRCCGTFHAVEPPFLGLRPDAFNEQGLPTPAQSHYCVEGTINEELIGDQPLECVDSFALRCGFPGAGSGSAG